jgi:hypothetical protein
MGFDLVAQGEVGAGGTSEDPLYYPVNAVPGEPSYGKSRACCAWHVGHSGEPDFAASAQR